MKNYKRAAVDREVTFNAPKYTCYACNDTGIINNSDKLINNHLPDYDIDDNGRRFSGQDLALICYCNAANAQYDIDGQIISHGYSCLLYTSPSPRDLSTSRMPSSA